MTTNTAYNFENLSEDITTENILLLAKQYYTHRGDIDDLREDLTRIKSLKKLITRYNDKDTLKERLIINHIMIMYNVFQPQFVYFLLKHSFPAEADWVVINTFLVFLRRSFDLIAVNDDIYKILKAI